MSDGSHNRAEVQQLLDEVASEAWGKGGRVGVLGTLLALTVLGVIAAAAIGLVSVSASWGQPSAVDLDVLAQGWRLP